jgi:hypothetical protein
MRRTIEKLFTACLVASTLVLPQLAAAAPPPLLPLQGYLTDDSDVALDGTYKLTFTLYDDALAGSSQYTSSEAVAVARGNFTVYLGDQAPLDLKIMKAHDSLWLEIKIVQACATDTTCNTGTLLNRTLSPRLQLATTAFAASAAYCGDSATVGGQAPSAFAAAGHTHAYSSLTGIPATFPPSAHTHPWSEITSVPAGFADGVDNDTTYSAAAGGGLRVSNANAFSVDSSGCSAGQVLKWSGTAWSCQSDANAGGTITSVTAGTGLNGGGSTGAITLTADQAGLQTLLDPQYVLKAGDTMAGNLTVSGRLDFGIYRADCTASAGTSFTDCTCKAGWAPIGGGGYPPSGSGYLQESWPRASGGTVSWRVGCRTLSGAQVACGAVYALCAHIPTW